MKSKRSDKHVNQAVLNLLSKFSEKKFPAESMNYYAVNFVNYSVVPYTTEKDKQTLKKALHNGKNDELLILCKSKYSALGELTINDENHVLAKQAPVIHFKEGKGQDHILIPLKVSMENYEEVTRALKAFKINNEDFMDMHTAFYKDLKALLENDTQLLLTKGELEFIYLNLWDRTGHVSEILFGSNSGRMMYEESDKFITCYSWLGANKNVGGLGRIMLELDRNTDVVSVKDFPLPALKEHHRIPCSLPTYLSHEIIAKNIFDEATNANIKDEIDTEEPSNGNTIMIFNKKVELDDWLKGQGYRGACGGERRSFGFQVPVLAPVVNDYRAKNLLEDPDKLVVTKKITA